MGQTDRADSDGVFPLAAPLVDAALDNTEGVANPQGQMLQQAMRKPLTLLPGTRTRQAHFAVSCFGKIISHPAGNFGTTMLNADKERRSEPSSLDATGELATSLSQKDGIEGYDGHGGVRGLRGYLTRR